MDARVQHLAFDPAALQALQAGSLGGDGTKMEPAMRLALDASFGSFERWREAFVVMGRALDGGSGAVLLVFQPRQGTLVNQSSVDPTQAVAGGVPILALDLSHQARPAGSDAGTGAGVDAFMRHIDWAAAYERYQQAVHAASEPFGAGHDELGDALLFDVRRAGVFEQASTMIPGASWRDPATVGDWSEVLPAGRNVVVYCVYGHEVGRATAMRLRAAGLEARYLRGGIDGWLAAGRPLVDKPVAPRP